MVNSELTLEKLQKLAKINGIKYTGLKKASLLAKLRKEDVVTKADKVSKSSRKSRRKSRKASKSRKAPCPEGKVRNRETGRCRNKKSKSRRKSRKASKSRRKAPCPEGKVRNRETGRCRNKKSKSRRKSRKASKSRRKSRKLEKMDTTSRRKQLNTAPQLGGRKSLDDDEKPRTM
jgi:hypothetical protein